MQRCAALKGCDRTSNRWPPLLTQWFSPSASLPVIAVDNDATGAVHDGFSLAPDFRWEFCAEIAMPWEANSERAKPGPQRARFWRDWPGKGQP